MPIDTVLMGEDVRTVANRTGVTRIGYDGHSCYLFLTDGSIIEIKSVVDNNLQGKLKFIHRLFLPTDNQDNQAQTNKLTTLTTSDERNKEAT